MVKDHRDRNGRQQKALPQQWPELEYEPAMWEPDDSFMPPRQRALNTGRYCTAVVPDIARTPVHVPAEVHTLLEDATAALIRLDEVADHALPGTEFAPLQSVLLRTESASSSQIEGISASSKRLAMAELGERAGKNATDVVGNVRAMHAAIRLAAEPSLDSILTMHEALMAGHERHTPGQLRREQVWIGGRSPVSANFVAPRHERVPANMQDLADFMKRDDLPSLAHAAVAHAQFETIHPFTDGNGRTGRALLHAMLHRSGINQRITAPISAGILIDPSHYFNALTQYRAGDLEPILRVVGESSIDGAALGRHLVEDLVARHEAMRQAVTARKGAAAHRLVDLLVAQPAVNTRLVTQRLKISEVAAGSAIDRLVGDGILEPASENRRNRVWIAPTVLDALDAFAARIRRQ